MTTGQPVRRSPEEGSVTVWLLFVPLLLMVLSGLSLDLWAGLSARGRIAAIADDAAIAGATAVSATGTRAGAQGLVLDPDEATRRALVAVDTHPGAADVTSRTATATPDAVSVTVHGQLEFLLLRLVGADTAPISVTGHARPVAVD